MILKEDQLIIEYLMGNDAFSQKTVDTFSYISNPDGTLRWVYPKNLKHPLFLNFYSTASLRSKVFSQLIKLAFYFKQSHRVKFGDLNINITEDSRLDKILKRYDHTGFSIFTGTIGKNRKVLVEIHKNNQTVLFAKIALEKESKVLVDNEIKQLKTLSKYNFKNLVVPEVLNSLETGIVEITNIKPASYKQYTNLTKLHITALTEMYEHSYVQIAIKEISCLKISKQNIEHLLSDYPQINSLDKKRVQQLSQSILLLVELVETKDEALPLSLSHGDFTPWNMYISKDVLYLFDWELGQSDIPMMFDLVHFIFQSEIMIKRSSYTKIKSVLQKILKMTATDELINKYKIDVNKHYILYLIYTVSYYLNKYTQQEILHDQVFWLVEIWEEAVADLHDNKGVVFH